MFTLLINEKRIHRQPTTQLTSSLIGFGYMFWIKAIQHQALMQDKKQVKCNDNYSRHGTFVVFLWDSGSQLSL